MNEHNTPLRMVIEANEKLHRRVMLAEKLLKPVSILQLCGIRTMDYCEIKAMVEEFWADEQNEA